MCGWVGGWVGRGARSSAHEAAGGTKDLHLAEVECVGVWAWQGCDENCVLRSLMAAPAVRAMQGDVSMTVHDDRAVLALQGPMAEAVLQVGAAPPGPHSLVREPQPHALHPTHPTSHRPHWCAAPGQGGPLHPSLWPICQAGHRGGALVHHQDGVRGEGAHRLWQAGACVCLEHPLSQV
jgi:hypothetical protein